MPLKPRRDRQIGAHCGVHGHVAVGIHRQIPDHPFGIEPRQGHLAEPAGAAERHPQRAPAKRLPLWRAGPAQRHFHQGLAAFAERGFGGHDHIHLAAGKLHLERFGKRADQLHLHARMVAAHALQHQRDRGVDDVHRHAEHNLPLPALAGQAGVDLVVHVHHALRIAQKLRARRGERNAAPATIQEAQVEHLFEPLELHGNR